MNWVFDFAQVETCHDVIAEAGDLFVCNSSWRWVLMVWTPKHTQIIFWAFSKQPVGNPYKNQQQTTSKSNNFFLKHSTTFETSFFFKKKFKKQLFGTKNNFHKISRSFKNNFLQKNTIFTKFQEVSKTTFNKQNNLKKLLKTMYVLTDLWTQYDNMFSCCILPQEIWTCDWICLSWLASQQVQSLGKD